jgi:hypothetical protein
LTRGTDLGEDTVAATTVKEGTAMKWAVSMILVLCLALPAWGVEAGPETNKLHVKVGPFFIQENDKKMNLEGAGPHVIRPGKRINITVTIENSGKEKSEPVKLKYVESGKKPGEPRFYRVQAIDPGKKWQRTFMARYEESGKKSVTASLVTLEDEPLRDSKGMPRPDSSNTGYVNLTVKKR